MQFATIATLATGSNAAIVEHTPDYYDNGIFTDGLNLVGADSSINFIVASIVTTLVWVMLALFICYAAKYYKALLEHHRDNFLRMIIAACQYFIGGEEEVEIFVFDASVQAGAIMTDNVTQAVQDISSTVTQTEDVTFFKPTPPQCFHCGTQTPAALTPLPIKKLTDYSMLATGDESGWYMAKTRNPDGSHVIHLSDPRYAETRECSSGMARKERKWCRPCHCCMIPILLIDTPHTDCHGVYRADINDPDLEIVPRPYV